MRAERHLLMMGGSISLQVVPTTSRGVRSSMALAPPPHVARAMEGLLRWQMEQQGTVGGMSMAAGVDAGRLVLHFDPSIGQRGAFYFAEPGEDAGPLQVHLNCCEIHLILCTIGKAEGSAAM